MVGAAGEYQGEVVGEHKDGGDDHGGHKQSGNPELDLEGSLDSLGFDVGEELADEGSDDANGGHGQREVDGLGLVHDFLGGGGDDESSASGLSEGAEKISAHTSNVTNVVTDVISNGAGVERGVLGETLADLAREISTDISSLGVDATTDSAEESDGGATEAVARDKLEDVGSLLPLGGADGSAVGEDDDLKDEESETDEDEAEDLAALEGNLESLESIDVAKVGGLHVASGRNHHADVAAKHGGGGADEEGKGGVGEVVLVAVDLLPGHVDGAEDDDAEQGTEDGESAVLFLQESDGTLLDVLVDILHALLAAFLSGGALEALLHLGSLLGDTDFVRLNLDFVHPVGIKASPEDTANGAADDDVMRVV
mmetsp:Transcript_33741/g.44504  ORF Transcript_33741/g.44504 Transcript_33741/m.44504 type:complete len:369 (+) Transcript_33741:1408-2514(+)